MANGNGDVVAALNELNCRAIRRPVRALIQLAYNADCETQEK